LNFQELFAINQIYGQAYANNIQLSVAVTNSKMRAFGEQKFMANN